MSWATERQKLKTEIFKELRQQKDRQKFVHSRGIKTFDPSNYTAGLYTTVGTFTFDQPFLTSPVISFGQVLADNSKPFVVQPVIDVWLTASAVVAGFTLGLYAVMDCPSGLTKHTVSWSAEGQASQYKSTSAQGQWQLEYNDSKADHLHYFTD